MADAIKNGVSDIHIEPYRFSSRVRYRLDGMLQEQEQYRQFLHDNYGAVVTRFKIMGKLDIAERRLPQDGAINFKIEGKVVDLRLSILPTANNERIVMRVLNKDAGDITLEQLNFEDQDLKKFKKIYSFNSRSYSCYWPNRIWKINNSLQHFKRGKQTTFKYSNCRRSC